MADADLTRYALTLGSQDSTTGWYAPSYSSSTIEGSIQPLGATFTALPVGGTARYPHTLFTADTVHEGDEVKDANGSYYKMPTRDEYFYLDQFSHFQCELKKRSPYYLRPSTSGTWLSSPYDPRNRTKVWLDAYLDNANLLKDDNSTQVSFITMFSGADYPISKVFVDKSIDLIYCVHAPETTALRLGIGYIERVPIDIFTMDKTGITGTNLKWQAEAELRRIAETYPAGSLRTLDRLADTDLGVGEVPLCSVRSLLNYKRYA